LQEHEAVVGAKRLCKWGPRLVKIFSAEDMEQALRIMSDIISDEVLAALIPQLAILDYGNGWINSALGA
jgi:hypothetical protein